MRDAQTGSQWLHYTGECVQGPLAGRALEALPLTVLTWKAFRERHPTATVIANTPSLLRRLMAHLDARRDVPSFFRLPSWFTRTMREVDSKTPKMAFGLGVVVGKRSIVRGQGVAGARFYPYEVLRRVRLVEDTVGPERLLVLWDQVGSTGVAFRREPDARRFELSPEWGLTDSEGNAYDFAGRVVSGPSQGQRLSPIPALATRWYGFQQSYPSADVFAPAP